MQVAKYGDNLYIYIAAMAKIVSTSSGCMFVCFQSGLKQLLQWRLETYIYLVTGESEMEIVQDSSIMEVT